MKYVALVDMFYISTNSGKEVFVEAGTEFDDMDKEYAQQEIDHGTLAMVEEVKDGISTDPVSR